MHFSCLTTWFKIGAGTTTTTTDAQVVHVVPVHEQGQRIRRVDRLVTTGSSA